MKKSIVKILTTICLAIVFISIISINTVHAEDQPQKLNNDEYGKFKLVVKNVTSSLEKNKDLKAYVKISNQATGETVLTTVVTVRYSNGQLVSGKLELPWGEYKLEQMLLLPDTGSEESNPSVKTQLPVLFTVKEKHLFTVKEKQ